MARTKLPDRRYSVTEEILVAMDSGKEQKLLVTFGLKDGRPAEVFCASFKAGTTMNTTVMDACILLSRLLQHGDSAEELSKTLASPPSIIGAIAAAAAKFQT